MPSLPHGHQPRHRSVRATGTAPRRPWPRVRGLATGAAVAATLVAVPIATSATTGASAATGQTAPVADSHVVSNRPDANFGTSTTLHVDHSPLKVTYLKFHVGSVTPTSATLTVTALRSDQTGFTVHRAASGWTESGLTYRNAPPPASQSCGSSGPVSTDHKVSIELDLAACPMSAGADVTLALTTSSSTDLRLGSRESATPPSLTLGSNPTQTAGAVTKVLVFMEENHSLSEMKAGMPYTAGLAARYGYATAYTAITHPSLPNYLAIASGKTYGITDDSGPSSHPLDGSTVFGQAVSAGRTAKIYAEGMTVNCMPSDTGLYAVKHNPWPYFTASSERTPCSSYDVPESRLATDAAAGTLPNVGMVVPNLCDDAHNCSLSVADSWFQTRMQSIFAGPDWASGHLAVVLTADEDDKTQGNTVLTVVIHPSQSGHVVTSPLTHYSLTRLYEDVAGVPHLNNAATAASMSTAFGLPLS